MDPPKEPTSGLQSPTTPRCQLGLRGSRLPHIELLQHLGDDLHQLILRAGQAVGIGVAADRGVDCKQ